MLFGVFVAGNALAQNAAFDVLEYQVAGNTRLPPIEIERAVYPYLGEHKSIDAIEKARSALEEAYHKAGYPTAVVDVPEQKVEGGIVKLQVTEGRIGKVRVLESRYYSQGRILAKLPELTPGTVPYMPEMQQQLNALNRTASGRAVIPILRSGKVPGTVDLDLKVRDEMPLHANLELDNRYTVDTSKLRLNATLRYDNLWQREHSLTLQYQTSPEDTSQVRVFSGTYVVHLDDPSKALAFYAVHSNSAVSTLGSVNVIGSGDIVGARALLTLPGSEQFSHNLSLGLDYKNFGQSLVVQGQDAPDTPIKYLPFQIQYLASSRDKKGTSQYNLAANFSLRGVGNDPQQFENKRYNARTSYFYLRGDMQRVQKLPAGMGLFARLGGQFSSQPLISNEEYSAGGADSVRGYLESEVLGDAGVQSTLELRSPSYAAKLSDKLQDLHFLAFIEAARLWVQSPRRYADATFNEQDRFNLASTGIGFRLSAWKRVTGSLDLAVPLRDVPSTQAGSTPTQRGDWRTQLSISYDLM